MSFTYLFLGFAAKIVTGLDDVITRIPILSSVTKKRKGQLVFSLGTLLAIFAAIMASFFLASFLRDFSYHHYLTSGLLFLFAILIYFDVFVHIPEKKVEKKYKKVKSEKLLSLFSIGFISSLATFLDDLVVFTPFFIDGFRKSFYVSTGIILATIVEIIVIILFARNLMNIKYKEKIASAGLVILGLLILFKVI